jgi:hypothetical protein
MSSDSDQLDLDPHWHVDCRIVADLPEDSVIGMRFLINAAVGAVTLTLALGTFWLFYSNLALRESIGDWEKRLADRQAEISEIETLQLAFNREVVAVDTAYDLVHNQLDVTQYLQQLGRTRPDIMVIDLIERTGREVTLRGSLRESSERASRVLTGYVQRLRDDPAVGPRFHEIVLTTLERLDESDTIRFVITFRLKTED